VSDSLSPLVAFGGNSHAARSARAKMQWRDRYGRWIEMGKGVKFKFKRADGTVVSARGVAVGNTDDPNVGQLFVQRDPNGLKDGFYNINSANAQEILASLDPSYLQQRGVALGKHTDGTDIGDRMDADIPAENQLPFSDSPYGWRRQDNGWVTDDGEFKIVPTSYPVKQKTGNQFILFQNNQPKSVGNFKDWPTVLAKVNEIDAQDPAGVPNNDQALADNREVQANLDGKKVAQQQAMAPDANGAKSAKDRAKAAVAPYDPDNKVAGLIDQGADSKDILDALTANPDFKRDYDDYMNRGAVELPNDQDKARWDHMEQQMAAIQAVDSEQDVRTADTGSGVNLDLATGDVAADGYLVPTNNNYEEHDLGEIGNLAQSMADYVNAHKDELVGGGKRLSVKVDNDNQKFSFDIVDQVPDHNAAQQLASERQSTEIYDVANNKVITTSQGRPRNDGSNANADPNALESVGNDTGTGGTVPDAAGTADQPEGTGGPDSGAPAAPVADDSNGNAGGDTSNAPADDNTDAQPSGPGSSDNASQPAGERSGAGGSESVQPAGSPEEAPAPDAGLAPLPEPAPQVVNPADNLPDDEKALQRMAQRLEARGAQIQDSPAAHAINDTLTAVYAKLDRIKNGDAPQTEERAPEADAPKSPDVSVPDAPASGDDKEQAAPDNGGKSEQPAQAEATPEKSEEEAPATPTDTEPTLDSVANEGTPTLDRPATPQAEPVKLVNGGEVVPGSPEDQEYIRLANEAQKARVEALKSQIAASKSKQPAGALPNYNNGMKRVDTAAVEKAKDERLGRDRGPQDTSVAAPANDADLAATPVSTMESRVKDAESRVAAARRALDSYEKRYGGADIPSNSTWKPGHLQRQANLNAAHANLRTVRQDAVRHAQANGDSALEVPENDGLAVGDKITWRDSQGNMHTGTIHSFTSRNMLVTEDNTRRFNEGLQPVTPDQVVERNGAPFDFNQPNAVPNEDTLVKGDRVQWTDRNGNTKTGVIDSVTEVGGEPAHYVKDSPDAFGKTAVKDSALRKVQDEPAAPESPAPTGNADTNRPSEGITPAPESVQEPTPSDDPFAQDISDAEADLAAAQRLAQRARARGDEDGAARYDQEAASAQQDLDDLRRMQERRNRAQRPAEPVAEAPAEEGAAPEAVNAPEEPVAAPETAEESVDAPVEDQAAPEAVDGAQAMQDLVGDDGLMDWERGILNGFDENDLRDPSAATSEPNVIDLPVLNDEAPLQIIDSDDGTDSDYMQGGFARGNIMLGTDGQYIGTHFGRDGQMMRAKFNSREDAQNWLGDRMAHEDGSENNPITKRAVNNDALDAVVYEGSDAETASDVAKSHLSDRLAGKDLSPEDADRIRSIVEDPDAMAGEVRDAQRELAAAPNTSNTGTRPRDPESNPANFTPARPSLVSPAKNEVVDPNLIIQDVKRNHDGYKMLQNGDVVVETRQVGRKQYEVIVRRTGNERFFPYVRETDIDTGESRVYAVSGETHSYKALKTKMNAAKALIRGRDPKKTLDRKKKGVQNLPAEAQGDFDYAPDPARDFIANTMLLRGEDAHTNAVAGLIAGLAARGEHRKVLDRLAADNRLDQDFVNTVLDSMTRRKVNDDLRAQLRNRAIAQQSHIPYGGGEPLVEGDWVDWTDYRQTVNGLPNPNLGRVYRGQVAALRQKTNDGNGAYVYSDSTYVIFPEMNREGGLNAGRQRQRISSQLKRVDSANAPESAPFFAKKEEKANAGEPIVRDFGLPSTALEGEHLPTIRRERQPEPAKDIELNADINGNTYVGSDDEPLSMGPTQEKFMLDFMETDPVDVKSPDIAPGDYMMVGNVPAKVVSNTEVDGAHDIELAFYGDDGKVKTQTLLGLQAWQSYRINRMRPDAYQEEVTPSEPKAWAHGDAVFVDDIPGGAGHIVNVGRGDRFIVKADQNGAQYAREGKFLHRPEENADSLADATIQPPEKQNDAAWKAEPVTDKQTNFIRVLMDRKQVSDRSRRNVEKMLAREDLTRGEASGLIDELKNYKDAEARKGSDGDAAQALVQNVADDLKKDPDAAVNGQDMQNAADAAKQSRAMSEREDQGYAVKQVGYSDIKFNGANAPFQNISAVYGRDLQVGDLIPRGTGTERRYYQVLSVRGDGNYEVRMVVQPEGRFAELDGEVLLRHVEPGRRITHVKRPTAKNRGYFKTVAAPKAAEFVPGTRNDYNQRAQKIVDDYNAGYVETKRIGEGAMNRGAWYIKTENGTEYFKKKVKTSNRNREYHNEIVVSKMLNALGMNDVQVVGLGDGETLVQTKINGRMAWETFPMMTRAREMQALKNVKNGKDRNGAIVGLVDFLVVNSDRHGQNWFIDDETGNVIPIDHGLTHFDTYNHRVRSPFAQLALGRLGRDRDFTTMGVGQHGHSGEPAFTKEQLIQMKTQIAALRSDFQEYAGGQDWYNFVLSRFDLLISRY